MAETHELSLVEAGGREIQEWTPRFAIGVDEAVELVEQKQIFFERVMKKDLHFGVIPGTSKKPTLLKAGAELLLSSMGLRPDFEVTERVVDLSGQGEGAGEPLIRYEVKCTIWRQTGPSWPQDRMFIAAGVGVCSSRETKYRYRMAERTCPDCGEPAIRKRKEEKGGGWQCIGNDKGGCWSTFAPGDPRIERQETGKILNPEIGDVDNTILKMASKRSKVDATLNATGCSDIFTQDVEDFPGRRPAARPAAATEEAAPINGDYEEVSTAPPPRQHSQAEGGGYRPPAGAASRALTDQELNELMMEAVACSVNWDDLVRGAHEACRTDAAGPLQVRHAGPILRAIRTNPV